MSTHAWIAACALAATPLFAALGRYLAHRRIPRGSVTWRRVEGLTPEYGARAHETFVDLALPYGDDGAADVVVEIRAAGLTDADVVVVVARRFPDPVEHPSDAGPRASLVVERDAGLARVALPDVPATGARIAFFTSAPLRDLAVTCRNADRQAVAAPMPQETSDLTVFVLPLLGLSFALCMWALADDDELSTTLLKAAWAGVLNVAAAQFGSLMTLRPCSIHDRIAAAFARRPAAFPPSSAARPTVAEVDRRRPAGNAAAN